MRSTIHGFLVLGLLAAGVGLFHPTAIRAQAPDPEEVTIPTVDKVELKGTWYKGGQGRNSPCVILLHAWGSDRTKGGWDGLARELQKKNYSVLSFDFRGHGKSRILRDKQVFWNTRQFPLNRYATRGNVNPGNLPLRIDYKSFFPQQLYYPMLINDIAAARRFLDERNDAGECNSGKTVLIGAEDGATLGMIWIAWEYQRPGIAPAAIGLPPPNLKAGSDIAGAIWLSIEANPHKLGGRLPYLNKTNRQWLVGSSAAGQLVSPLKEKTPMCFIHGETDPLGARDATYFYNRLFQAEGVAKENQTKYLVEVKNTKLRGAQLLGQQALKVDEKVTEFVDEVVKNRGGGNNWIQRNVANAMLIPVPLERLGFTFR